MIRWLLFLALAMAFACGQPGPSHTAQLYTCGMDPQVVQEGPGSCPICGMDLVPLHSAGDSSAVFVDSAPLQSMGVRTEVVRRQPLSRRLRTLGEVEVGEDEVSVVNTRFSGWIERVHVGRTGDEVRAGQPLFDIYSPELVAAQEEALLALRTAGADSSLARSAVRKLELWDLSPAEIERLTAEGVARRAVTVRAPRSGYVLHHRVEHGARVEAGEDLYRLGDLDTIWVTAQVYEIDAPWVEAGQPARVEPSYGAGQPVLGEVSTVYPTVDPHTRTLTVRVVLDNPELRLKPGMFATVHLEHRRIDDVLAVPTEAVLHSGRRELVFVALGDGHFEPREVTTGLVGDGHLTEVRSGLTEGEVVVVSGQFLLDSETKLQEALRTLLAARAQADHGRPAAPPAPDPRPATPSHTDHAHVDHPVAQPGQYTCPMNPKIVSDEPGRCPVCGMFLEQVPDAEEPTPGHVP